MDQNSQFRKKCFTVSVTSENKGAQTPCGHCPWLINILSLSCSLSAECIANNSWSYSHVSGYIGPCFVFRTAFDPNPKSVVTWELTNNSCPTPMCVVTFLLVPACQKSRSWAGVLGGPLTGWLCRTAQGHQSHGWRPPRDERTTKFPCREIVPFLHPGGAVYGPYRQTPSYA